MILPVMTMPLSLGSFHNIEIPQNVLAQQINIETNGTLALNQAPDPKVAIIKTEADAIDAYFTAHDMPLAGTGAKMAEEADANDLDWRLLPAISVRESTGGKDACDKVKNNPFGWGSCKIGFDSINGAIETVAQNLGGNNPNTATHYDNKTTEQILHAYNPPSVVPHYAKQVMSIMNAIGSADITTGTNTST